MQIQIGRSLFTACMLTMFAAGAGQSLAATCNYYVAPYPAGNNGYPGTQAQPFRTLLRAEEELEELSRAQHNNIQQTFTYNGVQFNTYPLTTAETVCVLAGQYYADYTTAPTPTVNNASDVAAIGAAAAYTLEIKVAGPSPTQPITFLGVKDSKGNLPQIIQTGYEGVQIDSTASNIVISGFDIHGQAYNANTTTALNRNATSYSDAWPYYDGACVLVKGNPVDTYQTANGAPYPVGVPNHITITGNLIYACGGGGFGSLKADYLTITNNMVFDNAWWGIYGSSGISLQTSVDSEIYPVNTATPVNTGTNPPKNLVANNYVYGNREYVPWANPSAEAITDGEGIIIDTNVNGPFNLTPQVPGGTVNTVNITPYLGATVVADNVIWHNGSSGIEVFESGNVLVTNNSTYRNRYYPTGTPVGTGPGQVNLTAEGILTRPEIAVGYITGPLTVVDNIFDSGATSGGVATDVIEGEKPASNAGKYAYVYLANNVYYAGPGVTVDPATTVDTKILTEGSGEVKGSNPDYALPTPPTNPAFGATSGMSPLDLRVTSASPADHDGWFSSWYHTPTDILGQAQPDTQYNLVGAYATPEP